MECQKCTLCRQRSRVIWGEGNPEAPIIVLLNNPGDREYRQGKPFICPTRQTLQEAAARVGLKDSDLFITYVLKCRPRGSYDKEESRRICSEYLFQQLERQKPPLAFCLDNTSVQWFLGI